MTRVTEPPGSSDRVVPVRGGRVTGHHAGPAPVSAIGALITEYEQRAAIAEREGATAPLANVYRVVLEELRPLNGAGAPDHPLPAAPPVAQLLTATEAARLLGVAPKWLYRRIDALPFARRLSPHVVRFDAAALARWLARRA